MNQCVFVSNHANDDGGAIFGGVPLVFESQFIGNSAIDDGGAIFGGAPRFVQCSFSENSAGDGGGCMYIYQSSIRIDGCIFERNVSGASGGGILTEGSPVITDSVFRNNSALVSAGAIFVLSKSASPRISSTLLCGNGSDQLIGFWTDDGGNTLSEKCPAKCIGDFDEDGIIGGLDLGLFLSEWGSIQADLNDDGLVDGIDLGILLAGWGNCITP